MDPGALPRDPSRRRFLRVGGVILVGGSSMAVSACGSARETVVAPVHPARDSEILNSALDLEHLAVAAYAACASALDSRLAPTARRFRDQEREHVDGLRQAIRRLGGKPNGARRAYALPDFEDGRAALRYAGELEAAKVAAYVDALPRLSEPELRATTASIACCEAEHLAVLRTALGQQPVPVAFVTGASA